MDSTTSLTSGWPIRQTDLARALGVPRQYVWYWRTHGLLPKPALTIKTATGVVPAYSPQQVEEIVKRHLEKRVTGQRPTSAIASN